MANFRWKSYTQENASFGAFSPEQADFRWKSYTQENASFGAFSPETGRLPLEESCVVPVQKEG